MNTTFSGNGSTGGMIYKLDWNGNILWSYKISDTTQMQNHDIFPMPNGNILVAIWEKISLATAVASGRNTALLGTSLWSAKIIELQPSGTNQATIVWQWRLWEHLVQDFDNTKSNFGVVANHPELMNVNFIGSSGNTSPDWIHLNAITYNDSLNQIMFSAHNLSEIYIIDHSTTTVQAASHSGGTHNKGGDFLYRWGNPQVYNRGTTTDQKLFLQHNPTWIPYGFKDGGNIMIFNNGVGRPSGNAASVDIIAPPINANGDYTIVGANAYTPANAYWTYPSTLTTNFFAQAMGGAQRLQNGNTLICEAGKGNFFEIDSNKNIVWQYVNPVGATGAISQGTTSTSLTTFRCTLLEKNYSGFNNHSLTATKPIELNPLSPSICDTLNSAVNGIENVKNDFEICPNPCGQSIVISHLSIVNTIEVFDLLGRKCISIVRHGEFVEPSKSQIINVESLPNGIYFIRINNVVQKFVKN
jgi:hypothetical protein